MDVGVFFIFNLEKVEIFIFFVIFFEVVGVFEVVFIFVVFMVDVGILYFWVLVGKGYN